MNKTIALALLTVMMAALFAGEALAAPYYYYGEPRTTSDYFASIDPLIASPYYPSMSRVYNSRDYFFRLNYPASTLSVSYQPLRSEERFPYGDMHRYDPLTGLTFNLGSKGARPFDYRYNNGLAVLSGRTAPSAGISAANTVSLAGPTPLPDPTRAGPLPVSPQYLNGIAYTQPPLQGLDFDTYVRGVTYR